MKDATIHAIDRWFGRPLCCFLTLVRRILPERRYGYPPRKILFLKLVEQGATVLAYTAVKRAVDLVGRDNVYFCVFEENRPILDAMEWIPRENVISIRSTNLTAFALDMLKTLRRFRRLGVDAVVDMEHFARASAVLAYLTGANIRVGLHRYTMEAPYRGDLLTHRILYNPYLHTGQYYDLLVRALAFPPDAFPMVPITEEELAASQVVPTCEPTASEKEALRAKLSNLAGEEISAPVVILNPNAADRIPGRKWPLDRYGELGRRLLGAFDNVTLIVTGTESERSRAEVLVKDCGSARIVDLTGRTTFRELLTLYHLADVLVTNDSGPAHFASMTPVDVVVLFGPETPRLYAPIGDRIHVVYKGLVGTPSVNALNHRVPPAGTGAAMDSIGVDEVYVLVEQALERRR